MTGRPLAPADRAVLWRGRAPDGPPIRLDQLVQASLEAYPTRASARKACERGEFAVGGELSEPSRWVSPGEELWWLGPADRPIPPLRLDIAVLYEDDWLAVVRKPPGLPTSGAHAQTVERALPLNLARSRLPDALTSPRAVHRLDAPTAGVLLIAKSRSAHAALGQAFEQRTVTKRYRAIVVGRLEGEGISEEEIDGRPARSRYLAVGHTPSLRTGWSTTVDLFPETGRTHQLRRHLASLGHPVLGDTQYGSPGTTLFGKGLFLFASHLGFAHPASGERLEIAAEEPSKFEAFRRRETARSLRSGGGTPPEAQGPADGR